MGNVNFQKDKITTMLGLILTLSSLAVLLLPTFIEVKKDMTDIWYMPVGIGALGILLIISPDTIIRGANKGIDKFNKNK